LKAPVRNGRGERKNIMTTWHIETYKFSKKNKSHVLGKHKGYGVYETLCGKMMQIEYAEVVREHNQNITYAYCSTCKKIAEKSEAHQ
jgi:hypothetical protein